jgi:hypothetical protein
MVLNASRFISSTNAQPIDDSSFLDEPGDGIDHMRTMSIFKGGFPASLARLGQAGALCGIGTAQVGDVLGDE